MHRFEEMKGGFPENGDRGHGDKRAFKNGGEVFGLMMAIGMFRIGRRFADAERKVSGARGGDVDDAFQRVG